MKKTASKIDIKKQNDIDSRKAVPENFTLTKGGASSISKAYFIGDEEGDQSNAVVEKDETASLFQNAGTIPPLYDPNVLATIFENSSSLRSNVDAYVTCIDSFGHTYEPTIDVDSIESREHVRDALRIERKHSRKTGKAALSKEALLEKAEPSDADVEKRIEQLKIEIRTERAELENFFENCTHEMPFSGPEGLRGLTRQDVEILGHGYWEVLRNSLGEISVFNYLVGRTIRLMPVDKTATEVDAVKRVSLLSSETIKVRKKFRRFVQIFENSNTPVYYREFGDPRAVDAKTGDIYPDLKTAQEKAKENRRPFTPATEILPFKITSPRTPYGVPRWIGTLLAVLGTRQSEEVNFLYFENRSVPPLAITVSGGSLNTNTVQRLEDFISNQVRGKRNFHKILVIEAETGNGDMQSGKMKIELHPLTQAQQSDALFQNYEEHNADKLGQAFRLPRLLRGDVRDFNRSTAAASLDFAELQVFGPQRQQFDWVMNKMIFPALGIKFHTFKSNAPTIREPEALSLMIKDLVTASVITPGEGREMAAGVFNRNFAKIKALWTEQPIAMTLAGRSMEDDLNTPDIDESEEFSGGGGAGTGGAAGGSPRDRLNANGGMSTGAAGTTQEALQVPQNTNKDGDGGGSIGAGGGAAVGGDLSSGGLAAGGGALVPAQGGLARGRRRRRLVKQASILQRMHSELLDAEREEYGKMEREVIKIPADLFYSCFRPSDAK